MSMVEKSVGLVLLVLLGFNVISFLFLLNSFFYTDLLFILFSLIKDCLLQFISISIPNMFFLSYMEFLEFMGSWVFWFYLPLWVSSVCFSIYSIFKPIKEPYREGVEPEAILSFNEMLLSLDGFYVGTVLQVSLFLVGVVCVLFYISHRRLVILNTLYILKVPFMKSWMRDCFNSSTSFFFGLMSNHPLSLVIFLNLFSLMLLILVSKSPLCSLVSLLSFYPIYYVIICFIFGLATAAFLSLLEVLVKINPVVGSSMFSNFPLLSNLGNFFFSSKYFGFPYLFYLLLCSKKWFTGLSLNFFENKFNMLSHTMFYKCLYSINSKHFMGLDVSSARELTFYFKLWLWIFSSFVFLSYSIVIVICYFLMESFEVLDINSILSLYPLIYWLFGFFFLVFLMIHKYLTNNMGVLLMTNSSKFSYSGPFMMVSKFGDINFLKFVSFTWNINWFGCFFAILLVVSFYSVFFILCYHLLFYTFEGEAEVLTYSFINSNSNSLPDWIYFSSYSFSLVFSIIGTYWLGLYPFCNSLVCSVDWQWEIKAYSSHPGYSEHRSSYFADNYISPFLKFYFSFLHFPTFFVINSLVVWSWCPSFLYEFGVILMVYLFFYYLSSYVFFVSFVNPMFELGQCEVVNMELNYSKSMWSAKGMTESFWMYMGYEDCWVPSGWIKEFPLLIHKFMVYFSIFYIWIFFYYIIYKFLMKAMYVFFNSFVDYFYWSNWVASLEEDDSCSLASSVFFCMKQVFFYWSKEFYYLQKVMKCFFMFMCEMICMKSDYSYKSKYAVSFDYGKSCQNLNLSMSKL